MSYLSLLILGLTLFLPLFIIFHLWRKKHFNKLHWLLHTLESGIFVIFIFMIWRWDWTSYYLIFIFFLLLFISAYLSFVRVKNIKNPHRWRWILYYSSSLFVLLTLNIIVLSGYFYSDKTIKLSFPLKNGIYYIAQGGNNLILNNHYSSSSQKYALDIVKLNAFGNRASGLYPKELNAYNIWQDVIYSPCEGKILKVIDNLPDNIVSQKNEDHPAGNYIVIECKGAKVLLAHLSEGSLKHRVGTTIKEGEPLGKVGNSGNTTEPHLHIHAEESGIEPTLEGKGIPIIFEGKFLVRNNLVFK